MKSCLLFIIGILLTGCSNGQIKLAENGLKNDSNQITAEQSELIFSNTKVFPNNTQLSIAIIENEKVKFIGIKRINDTLKFVDNEQKVFEIGSISKVFTSTLLTSLEQENRLKLTDPIQQYLDFELSEGKVITLQELSNHTSGLPSLPANLNLSTTDPSNPFKNYGEEELKEYLTEKIKLNQDPGVEFEYSNLGAGTLGFILTKITNSTYEDLLQERISSKYGMTNTTTNQERIKENLVIGLDPNGDETSNLDLDIVVGAGGILSSTFDLSKFAIAQFDTENKDLALTQKPTFTISDNMKIGLGWAIPKTTSGKDLIWHNGGTGGYSSSMVLDLENKNGAIILSNVSAFNKEMGNIDKLTFGIIETLNNK